MNPAAHVAEAELVSYADIETVPPEPKSLRFVAY